MSVLRTQHVVIAGAGGIGCPATWALRLSGVGRITVLDPDVVEPSNLPRQVLFDEHDLGHPKAERVWRRFGRGDVDHVGHHAPLDHTNADAILADADLVIDATDGAHAKDWINQLAVRRAIPLVHAAGLRAEARMLDVPAGGQPCLACLFGRLTEETGSCADLGVWNGVVGVVGFLAAQEATRMLLEPKRAPTGYRVLDFESGRATTLRAAADGACPVCATEAALEPYPEPFGCDVPDASGASREPTGPALDLRDEACPMNLLRARRALADLPAGAVLAIRLGEEGAATVPDGVRALGHKVLVETPAGSGLDLHVEVVGAAKDDPAFDGADLHRYARQIVLPEVGERGQRRLMDARVCFAGDVDGLYGPALESAMRYTQAAGVGTIVDEPEDATHVAWAGGGEVPKLPEGAIVLQRDGEDSDRVRAGFDIERAITWEQRYVDFPVALAWGALLADLVQRAIVLDEPPEQSFAITFEGDVA